VKRKGRYFLVEPRRTTESSGNAVGWVGRNVSAWGGEIQAQIHSFFKQQVEIRGGPRNPKGYGVGGKRGENRKGEDFEGRGLKGELDGRIAKAWGDRCQGSRREAKKSGEKGEG